MSGTGRLIKEFVPGYSNPRGRPDGEQCSNCSVYAPKIVDIKALGTETQMKGLCTFNPPEPIFIGHGVAMLYPEVPSTNWCDKHKK